MFRTRTSHSRIRTLFPVPSFMTLDPVGLDISPQSICVMKLRRTKQGLIPHVYKEVMLTDTCAPLETLDDLGRCESLRTALRTLQEELSLKFVRVSLPELKTYVFKTTVPKAALPTIEDALIVALQENVPLDPQDVLYDFDILPERPEKTTIDVVVTVFPRVIIETYTALLNEVGLTAIAFESESQSNARAVIAQGNTTPYLLVHMGYTKVSLSIIEQGIVHYTSSIPYTSQEIIADFNAQPAQVLKTKINTLLVYWFTNKRNPDAEAQISNTILTGPFANTTGLVGFLEKHIRINADVANVWCNCFDINTYIPEIPQQESLKYSTAIGLALLRE